jgi:hypothetical protein
MPIIAFTIDELLLANTTTDDYSGNIYTLGRLGVGASVIGKFEKSGDSDWFQVYLQAGVTYHYKLQLDGSSWSLDQPSLYVRSASGGIGLGSTLLDHSYPVDAAQNQGFTPFASGVYFIGVDGAGNTGGYTLSLNKETPSYQDDLPNTLATAVALPVDVQRSGKVDGPGDVDMYTLDLVDGEAYTIMLDKPAGTYIALSLMINGEPSWQFFEANDTTLVSQIMAGGAMKLGVAVYGDYGSTGAYQLRYSRTIDHDGLTGDIHTSGYLYGTSFSGNLEQAGAADWVKVVLDPGKRYALELYSAASSANSLGQGGLALPKLSLMDENGKVLASATGGGLGGDPRIEFTVPASASAYGRYFLGVSDQLGKGTGTYTFAVHEAPATAAGDVSNDPTNGPLLTLGSVLNGRMDAEGDADYYSVRLTAGVIYDFDVSLPSGGDKYVFSALQTRGGGSFVGDSIFPGDGHHHTLFRPSASGYYVFGLRDANFVGTYGLAFSQAANQDEAGDSIDSAAPLVVGAAAIQGRINLSNDVDLYRVRLDQGQRYDFYLDGGVFKTYGDRLWYGGTLQLLDSKGLAIGQPVVDDGTTVAHLGYTAAASGDYYLSVSHQSNSTMIGTYNLSAERADGSAVAAPVVNETEVRSTDGYVVLTGSAPAGSVVHFYTPEKEIGSVAADALGHFRWVSTRLSDDAYYLHTVAVNAAGKQSVPGAQFYLVVDTVAPDAPTLQAGAPQGNSVTFSGHSETASVVRIWADGVLLGTARADLSQHWSVTLSLPNGGYVLSATAEDTVGHLSPASSAVQLQVGPVSLAAPTLGTADGKQLLASHQVLLSGTAEAGLTVQVREAGAVVASAKADASGHWNAVTSVLADGHHTLTARAIDGAGTTSGASLALALDIDTTAPAAPLIQVRLGADGATFGPRPVLGGTSEAGAAITIRVDGAIAGHALAGQDGAWQWQSAELLNGSHSFAASASDALGNSSPYGAPLTVLVRTGAPQLGGAGADLIRLEPGSHVVDGGAGLDTLLAAGAASSYTVARVAEGLALTAADGASALLQNIERIQFDDGARAYDSDGVAGQAYRLYQAAFGRQPDQAGLGYWIAQMDKGMPLHDVADGFVHSAEYATLYGASPTSAELVALLYQNVLHRAPDAAGEAYWTGVLQQGASVADVLTNFSESPENQIQVTGAIQAGMAYLPYP